MIEILRKFSLILGITLLLYEKKAHCAFFNICILRDLNTLIDIWDIYIISYISITSFQMLKIHFHQMKTIKIIIGMSFSYGK